MRFSLVVATLGRVEELREFLKSLSAQTFQDFEVLVIDQNSDDRLAWIDEAGVYGFPVRHILSSVRNLSNARNIGLRHAVGEILSFPDDDCTYPADLLANMDRAFRDHPEIVVRTGLVIDPVDGTTGGRWQSVSGKIDSWNVWICAQASNIFITLSAANAVGDFDEQLGIGSIFGSAEESDLVLRASRVGMAWFDPSQIVNHPSKRFSPVAVNRAFSYGAGLGYALRKNDVPMRLLLVFLIRPFGGCILNLMRGRIMKATYHWRTLRGRIFGYRAYEDGGKPSRRDSIGKAADMSHGTV